MYLQPACDPQITRSLVTPVYTNLEQMRYPVTLKFTEKRPEYAMILGDSTEPFEGTISGPQAATAENTPRHEDEVLFSRCQPLQGTLESFRQLHIGGVSLPTQFSSPYPMNFSMICLCEYCLKYMSSDYAVRRHGFKCLGRSPPGSEIYRDGEWSIWEVDGANAKVYCQNLCLLAKLFLESKTLYYDVEPFNFYVLTKYDGFGHKFVGYFSKQKLYCGGPQRDQQTNNVSCIMVLPLPEYRGLGQYMIAFSYLLTRVQMATGTPEKPLSTLGARSYETYWKYVVSEYICDRSETSIREISTSTNLTLNDVVYTLEILGWLQEGGELCVDYTEAERIISEYKGRQPLVLKSENLLWA